MQLAAVRSENALGSDPSEDDISLVRVVAFTGGPRLEKDNIVENFNDAIDAMTDYVNNNGGFTVYGWYKRGEKDDKSSDEDAKTESSEFIYHIVHLYCTTEPIQNGHIVESLKFDTANIYFYSKK